MPDGGHGWRSGAALPLQSSLDGGEGYTARRNPDTEASLERDMNTPGGSCAGWVETHCLFILPPRWLGDSGFSHMPLTFSELHRGGSDPHAHLARFSLPLSYLSHLGRFSALDGTL